MCAQSKNLDIFIYTAADIFNVFEVRIHGRGGQGALMSAHILARTAFLSGFQTQDFALYGAERRGAPITSFVRYDKKPILERGYITTPDAVIILDETLNFDVMLAGLKADGFVLINSHRPLSWFVKKFKIKQNCHVIPATDIALKILGRPLANAVALGAAAKLLKLKQNNLEKAIAIELGEADHPEAVEKNITASRECASKVR